MKGKQRAFLKRMANDMECAFQIGKEGKSKNIIKQYDEILTAREMVKTNVLKSCDEEAKDIAGFLAEKTNSEVVCVIGRKFVLYRKSEKLSLEGKSIQIPK